MPPGNSSFGEAASGSFVVVTGCYAQLKPDAVAKIEGGCSAGCRQKKDLLQYLGDLRK